MEGMRDYPDNFFDLAIVDPPYGINIEQRVYKDNKKWDSNIPDKSYFTELFRVSKHQIIWGANNFLEHLYSIKGFITWDKKITDHHRHNMFEIAWTSLNQRAKTFYCPPPGERGFYTIDCKRIHPTQKPIDLYRWLLKHYANEGDRLLSTHVGSASDLIAFEDFGCEYVGYEIDEDYYADASKRLANHKAQLTIF